MNPTKGDIMNDPFAPFTVEENEEFTQLNMKENPTDLEKKRMIEILVHFRMRSNYENLVQLLHPKDSQKVVRDYLLK